VVVGGYFSLFSLFKRTVAEEEGERVRERERERKYDFESLKRKAGLRGGGHISRYVKLLRMCCCPDGGGGRILARSLHSLWRRRKMRGVLVGIHSLTSIPFLSLLICLIILMR
jgi:hypothetical protein